MAGFFFSLHTMFGTRQKQGQTLSSFRLIESLSNQRSFAGIFTKCCVALIGALLVDTPDC